MVNGFNAPKDFICIYEVDGEGIYIHESQIPFFNLKKKISNNEGEF